MGQNWSLRWRHNGHDSVSNHLPHDCLLHRLFRRRSKKTSKLRVTGLCAGNSPGTGEFPAQMASYAENVSIWWRHHVQRMDRCLTAPRYYHCSLSMQKVFRGIYLRAISRDVMKEIKLLKWLLRHPSQSVNTTFSATFYAFCVNKCVMC